MFYLISFVVDYLSDMFGVAHVSWGRIADDSVVELEHERDFLFGFSLRDWPVERRK